MQRRRFLHAVGASVAAIASPLASAAAQLEAPREFWHGIRAQYDVDRTVTNLENAYWGVMARPVATAYFERIRFVNRVNVVYARDSVTSQPYSADVRRVVEQIERAVGAEPGEIAPTRGGTEALQNLIFASYTFGTATAASTITLRLDNATNALYRNHLNYLKDLAPEMGRNFAVVYSVRF